MFCRTFWAAYVYGYGWGLFATTGLVTAGDGTGVAHGFGYIVDCVQ